MIITERKIETKKALPIISSTFFALFFPRAIGIRDDAPEAIIYNYFLRSCIEYKF